MIATDYDYDALMLALDEAIATDAYNRDIAFNPPHTWMRELAAVCAALAAAGPGGRVTFNELYLSDVPYNDDEPDEGLGDIGLYLAFHHVIVNKLADGVSPYSPGERTHADLVLRVLPF